MLDVGCGAGAAGLGLVPPAVRVTGVDGSPAMLAAFERRAVAIGVEHDAVEGVWPAVAPQVDSADVVVCHHVAYNVGAIDAFVRALGTHARRRVVVELTDRHPATPLAPLWERFWGLARPTEPTSGLFVDVVLEAGFRPSVSQRDRAVRRAQGEPAEQVAFVRRRLCLSADRDAEIAAALAADPRPVTSVVTVWWDVDAPARPRRVHRGDADAAVQLQSVT